jgi:hypothetical protein
VTSNYSVIASSHSLQFPTARAKSSKSLLGGATQRRPTVGTPLLPTPLPGSPVSQQPKTHQTRTVGRWVGRLNCCWPSPEESFLVSGLVETSDHGVFSESFLRLYQLRKAVVVKLRKQRRNSSGSSDAKVVIYHSCNFYCSNSFQNAIKEMCNLTSAFQYGKKLNSMIRIKLRKLYRQE